ncbi:UNVERIFIED_CONTAM: hypothetical protein GTU68_001247 [Idotea baltica]|nr:hypothetical protein [Idotea baltica]
MLSCALMLGASAAQAHSVSFSIGQTSESTAVYRVATQFNFGTKWLESDTGHLTGYWDAGYTYWIGDDTASNNSISLSPVFTYVFNSSGGITPYIEAGIGGALFSSTELETNDLSTSFLFEDRIGVGIRFAKVHDVALRIIHYSNGGIKEPNDGVENFGINYRYSF